MTCMTGVLQWRDTDSKKNGTGKQGGKVTFYVREQLECLGMNDEPTESLWVRIKEQIGMGDIVVCLL